jgi:hypothetical protein
MHICDLKALETKVQTPEQSSSKRVLSSFSNAQELSGWSLAPTAHRLEAYDNKTHEYKIHRDFSGCDL